jgi:hypothetical protein
MVTLVRLWFKSNKRRSNDLMFNYISYKIELKLLEITGVRRRPASSQVATRNENKTQVTGTLGTQVFALQKF